MTPPPSIFICGRGRREKCRWCSSDRVKLCDAVVTTSKSGTCDAPMCFAHAKKTGPNRDLCPPHARAAEAAAKASTEPSS